MTTQSTPDADATSTRRRGTLRVYLGAAPGVGKTHAMLEEGRRRAARGTRVVVGIVDAHGRAPINRLLVGMTVVRPMTVLEDGVAYPELDVDAVLATGCLLYTSPSPRD